MMKLFPSRQKFMQMTRWGRKGFTLVEIMIVVLIIGILLAIAVPNFIKARETSRTKSCVANLKQIDAATEQWAMDNKASQNATVGLSTLIGAGSTTTYMKNSPSCPSGGTYSDPETVGTSPTCSVGGSHALPT
jgi:type II secretion system protein G